MFTFKVSDQSIKDVEQSVRDVFEKVIKNEKMLSEVGETVVTDIKFQTRRGVSPVTGERFKPLKQSWINKREAIAFVSSTDPAFSKNRSNLTLSGQLLDALRMSVAGVGKIKLFFEGSHQPYLAKYVEIFKRKRPVRGGFTTIRKGRSGSRQVGNILPNELLAQYVAENGRPFMGVRDTLKPRLNRIVIAYIRRATRVFSKFN
jgi:hypothetical protein